MKNPITILGIATAITCIAGAQTFASRLTDPDPVKKVAKKDAWISLFNGRDLTGWHGYNKKTPVVNWEVENGALVCLGTVKGTDTGGDIATDKEFSNFELVWEWKIDKGSNSGVLYHVVEDPKYTSTYQTGPEYQIIDDLGWVPDKLEDWQKTGADYAMTVPNSEKKLKPVGEWNTSKIVFNKGHVEHWLNGKKILEFTAWGRDWTAKKAAGKWKEHPEYGMAKTGRIALQDHGHKAYFKNIRIREL
ncbi:DUF1080 domain-containing protein [Mucilaginibacter terrenus]|uniref:DUF1080 domain-containing protein n=1 Tax=Mucilaginibacter terrenus TaxID=2482727 RepID=A0A3E2NXC6_9SPHI|nr:DUF1080 domain-containing protein [Mucilaginibacter terrenus]RFZ85674.1 DUF1080 domain-containing protein [Mucilaginibacter terrenus]